MNDPGDSSIPDTQQKFKEAHRLFGADVDSMEMELDMVRTQTLLETDVDPSLIAKWHWNDPV